jgi:hypothetical protein
MSIFPICLPKFPYTPCSTSDSLKQRENFRSNKSNGLHLKQNRTLFLKNRLLFFENTTLVPFTENN